jgi:hypothetical protein
MNPFANRLGEIVFVAAMLARIPAAFADDNTNGASPADPVVTTGADVVSTAPQDVGASEPPYDINADTDPAALTDFREALDPYGTWEQDPTYGVVWVPSPDVVGSDFAPYVTAGNWGVSDGGEWTWVSDYSWGWAPFHYGRWAWIGHHGWGWVPGRVYAPAWVVWRTGYYDDYYVGWAPMPPTWYWYGGFAVGLGFRPYLPFVFCPSHHVFAPHVYNHIVPASHVGAIAARTQPYYAATASVAGSNHALAMTHGPSFATAHVPASAVPTQRIAPDAHTTAFAHSSSHVYRGNEGLGLAHSTTLGGGYASGYNQARPALPQAASPRAYPPSYRSAPSYLPSLGNRSAPSYAPRASGSATYAAPRAYAPSPSLRAEPSFHASAPSYHAAPSFHASAPSYHAAPSLHASAPSYHAAPSSHGGGGGGRHR